MVIPFLHSTPLWFYILPLSFLIPGIVIVTFSEGVYVDARISAVIQWLKVLGFGRERNIQFSELKGVSIKERVTKSTTSGSLVFDVWLFGEEGSLKIYRASSEDEAKKVAERLSTLTGLPRTQPPSQRISSGKLLIIVVSAILLPILMLGLFLTIRAML